MKLFPLIFASLSQGEIEIVLTLCTTNLNFHQGSSLCDGQTSLFAVTCSAGSAKIVVDEVCRSAKYSFIDWDATFIHGDSGKLTDADVDSLG